eukprot:884012-Prorocentrum_minimum.AAC.1
MRSGRAVAIDLDMMCSWVLCRARPPCVEIVRKQPGGEPIELSSVSPPSKSGLQLLKRESIHPEFDTGRQSVSQSVEFRREPRNAQPRSLHRLRENRVGRRSGTTRASSQNQSQEGRQYIPS